MPAVTYPIQGKTCNIPVQENVQSFKFTDDKGEEHTVYFNEEQYNFLMKHRSKMQCRLSMFGTRRLSPIEEEVFNKEFETYYSNKNGQ